MSDYTVETIDLTPTARIRIVQDNDGQNPLEDWDHGCQLLTFGSRDRTAFNIDDSKGRSFFLTKPSLTDYREFWTLDDKGEWWFTEDDYAQYRTPYEYRQLPSLLTAFQRECAAWGTITEAHEGYTFRLYDEDWDSIAGFMWVTRASYFDGQMLPHTSRLTTAHRTIATRYLTGTFQAFNDWATGEVYGAIVEELVPYASRHGITHEWEETESCWGFYLDHDLPWHQRFDFIVHDMGYGESLEAAA